jgi:Tol biopolymer transport system component
MYTMDVDGSGQTKVTTSPSVPDGGFEPSWSPDGAQIAFTSSARTYIVDADGSGLTGPLVPYGVNHFEPAWSPDGRKIAFQSMDYGTYDIFVVNADGSGLMRLTDDALGDWEPAWSPDGRRIAFARKLSESDSDIYVMNADGSGETRLTGDPGLDSSPDWSPDGTKIVFSRRQAEAFSHLYAMSGDGSGPNAADVDRGARRGAEVVAGRNAHRLYGPRLRDLRGEGGRQRADASDEQYVLGPVA